MTKTPSPGMLALIAATLGPDLDPDSAIRHAHDLYVRAANFDPASNVSRSSFAERLATTLLLQPEKCDDEVRRYLSENGLRLKTGRAVLDNLKKFHVEYVRSNRPEEGYDYPCPKGLNKEAAQAHWITWLNKLKHGDNYAIPVWTLEGLVKSKKDRKRDGGLKSIQTAAKKNLRRRKKSP